MGIFLNILMEFIFFLAGFCCGMRIIKRKYLYVSRKLLAAFNNDTYNLDFMTGAGVTLNVVFDNKLDCDVKLALTKKILKNNIDNKERK